MATVTVNDTPIRYEDSGGDGPAILFSHGFLMDHTMFDAQVEALSGDYRCIRWDERGFGDTPANVPFTYWDSADDSVAVLDACGVDQAVFVGMSQGGFLSIRAALAHPDRVRALVVIDSCADIDDPETIEGYQGMLAGFTSGDQPTQQAVAEGVADLILGDEALSAAWMPRWFANLERSDLNIAGQALLTRDDVQHRAAEIACPVLAIHGGDDQAISVDRARRFVEAVADGRGVMVVDGAAHAPNMTHPSIVNHALVDFLSSL
ncbi:MAG: alpha/beta hydrolase [Acidimicrobiales bacterium]